MALPLRLSFAVARPLPSGLLFLLREVDHIGVGDPQPRIAEDGGCSAVDTAKPTCVRARVRACTVSRTHTCAHLRMSALECAAIARLVRLDGTSLRG